MGNYRGLKLTEQAMKILERIVDGLIRQVVSIDDSVWLCPRQRHYRCNLCGPAAAGEISSNEQEALYGLRGSLRKHLIVSLGRLSGGP